MKNLKNIDLDDLRVKIEQLKKNTDNSDSLEFAERIETIVSMSGKGIDSARWFNNRDEFERLHDAYKRAVGYDQLSNLDWNDLFL